MQYFSIPSPSYVLELDKLESNLKILNNVQEQSGAKILLALKGYAFWRRFELVRKYLAGTAASGINEARLGFEEVGGRESNKEICVFSPAYKTEEINSLLSIATHIVFNSFSQWQKFKPMIESKNKQLISLGLTPISVGLRINPLYSEVSPEIYNPCAKASRLGIVPTEFEKNVKKYGLEGIDGLHFHTHCEQNADALERTLKHIEQHFGQFIPQMKWINFGGGHHITRKDYNLDLLIQIILEFKARYNDIEVFLEPGEAVGWQCGFLIGEVVDIVYNEKNIAILDVSASAHMPDCLEMPYRPDLFKVSYDKDNNEILESDLGEKGAYSYRFGGPTCLAGDIIGDFSFDSELNIGDRIVFLDMLHYTIVKNTTFNGVPLPSLGVIENDRFQLLQDFDYLAYKNRN